MGKPLNGDFHGTVHGISWDFSWDLINGIYIQLYTVTLSIKEYNMVQHLLTSFPIVGRSPDCGWFFSVSSTRWATPATSTPSGHQTWQRIVVPTINGAFKCFYWEKPLFQCGKLSMVSMVTRDVSSSPTAPGLERNQVGLVLKVQSQCLVPPGPSALRKTSVKFLNGWIPSGKLT